MEAALSKDEELEALFNWNPPRLSLAIVGSSKSKKSREPGFYDRHLHDELILKEVKAMPSLPQDIASVVDRAIASIRDRNIELPPIRMDGFFCTAARRTNMIRSTSTEMTDERSVVNFYRKTIADICIPVASTLALHPLIPTWDAVLEFSEVPTIRKDVIADSVLRVTTDLLSHFKGRSVDPSKYPVISSSFLDPEKVEGLAEVSKRFADFAVWEFKSLSVGPEPVMEGVSALTSVTPFPWEKCNGVDCHKHKTVPDHIPPPVDATATPWKLPDDTTENIRFEPSTSGTSRLRRSTSVMELKTRQSSKEVQPKLFQSSSKSLVGKGKRKRESGDEAGKGDEDVNNDSESNYSPEINTAPNDAYRSPEELTAKKFLQLAWAEAVRNDATMICLQAGSLEYIGIRHRNTQRLYISNIISPHDCENPRYGKLHVGLFIAAVEDAMNRALQLKKMEEENEASGPGAHPSTSGYDPESEDPRDGPRGSKRRKRDGDGSGKRSRSVEQKGKGKATYQSRADFIHETELRRLAFLYLRYGIYNSPIPASFIRRLSPPLLLDETDFRDDEGMTLILTSEIAEGATGKVHGGTLEVENSWGKTFIERVVAKLAFSNTQKDRLQNEYTIYQRLASKDIPGLPAVIGIFDNFDGGPRMLLMTHAGTCLRHGEPISSSQRAGFLSTLEKIHRAGVLHNDVRLQNLLVDEYGEVTIIDFDLSKERPSEKQMKREQAILTGLLDNLGSY